MKAIFMNKTISFLKKYCTYSNEEIEKLEYGLEGIYLTITKLIIIFITAALLGIVKEFITLIFLFNIIRYTGFGFHANKSYECLLFSAFCFLIIPIFFINVNLTKFIYILICLFCIFNYLLFAPADTIKRPLIDKKKRIIRKIITIIIGITYFAIGFLLFNHWISSILLSALVIEAIVVNPITYYFFKQPYNNFKNFKFD